MRQRLRAKLREKGGPIGGSLADEFDYKVYIVIQYVQGAERRTFEVEFVETHMANDTPAFEDGMKKGRVMQNLTMRDMVFLTARRWAPMTALEPYQPIDIILGQHIKSIRALVFSRWKHRSSGQKRNPYCLIKERFGLKNTDFNNPFNHLKKSVVDSEFKCLITVGQKDGATHAYKVQLSASQDVLNSRSNVHQFSDNLTASQVLKAHEFLWAAKDKADRKLLKHLAGPMGPCQVAPTGPQLASSSGHLLRQAGPTAATSQPQTPKKQDGNDNKELNNQASSSEATSSAPKKNAKSKEKLKTCGPSDQI